MRIIQPDQARHEPSRSAIAEIGRLGMGVVQTNATGQTYPSSTDHFVARGDFARQFHELLGEKPNRIPIRFYSDKTDFSCQERLELRDKNGKLYGYGDGETFTFYSQKTKSFSSQISINQRPDIQPAALAFLRQGLTVEKAKLIDWKPTLNLRFLIADFPCVGYWQLSVHGKNSSIPNLRDTFDLWQQTLKSVRHLPFLLTIKKVKSDTSGSARQYCVAGLIPDFPLEAALQLSELLHGQPELLPAPLIHKHLVRGEAIVYRQPVQHQIGPGPSGTI